MVISEKSDKLLPVPEVGKFYHFWDDGKTGVSRHYICKVESIIKPEEAKTIIFNSDALQRPMSLYEIWKNEVKECDWLYAEETDCILKISCPKYDDNFLYAARTKNGGFFTVNVQSFWQSGRIDITNEIYDSVIESHKKGGYDYSAYESQTY